MWFNRVPSEVKCQCGGDLNHSDFNQSAKYVDKYKYKYKYNSLLVHQSRIDPLGLKHLVVNTSITIANYNVNLITRERKSIQNDSSKQ